MSSGGLSRPALDKAARAAFQVLIPLLVYAAVLLISYPHPLRPMSIAARFSFTSTLLGMGIVFYSVFCLKSWVGTTAAFAATLGLFGLSLAGLWISGQSSSTIISGLLPWSDASSYYLDALGWLNGRTFSQFSSWRPFFSGLFSFLLLLTGSNLQISLAILVAITATACYLLIREVLRFHGPAAALIVLVILFFYYRQRISGMVLSEHLGLAFGALGFALLYRGGAALNRWEILGGIFLVAMGLNTRPGAFFVLPALALWAAWVQRGQNFFSWKMLLGAVAVIAAVFAANSLVLRLVAGSPTLPFANFSYALYGLVTGGRGFSVVNIDHPEILTLQGTERYLKVYGLVFEAFKQNPFGIVQGSMEHWRLFFSNSYYSVFSYISGENLTLTLFARAGLYGLSIAGLWGCIRSHKDPICLLILFCLPALLLSVPFVPPVDAYGLRLYATTMPVIAILPAFGLSWLVGKFEKRLPFLTERGAQMGSPAASFAAALVVVTLMAPLLVKWASRPARAAEFTCPVGSEAASVWLSPGSSVTILPEKVFFLDRLPYFHKGRFDQQAHGLPSVDTAAEFEAIPAPAVLFETIDLKTNGETWLIADPDLLAGKAGLLNVCGSFGEKGLALANRFIFVQSAEPALAASHP